MPLPDDVRTSAESHVELFCSNRIPNDLRDEVRVDYEIKGSNLTVVERRPPWNPEMGSEWTSSEIAQRRERSRHHDPP